MYADISPRIGLEVKKLFILRVAVLNLKYNNNKDKQLLCFRYLKYIRSPARNFNRLQRIEILMSSKYSKTFFRSVRSLNTKMSEHFFYKNPANIAQKQKKQL